MYNTTIHGTRRQQVTTQSGALLERQYVFLPAETWEALRRLCVTQHRSGSQIIASLINIASAQVGTRNDIKTDRIK
jgi:hypothetical protein